MRYLLLVVAHVVLFSSLAYAAPTVFFKDGTTMAGNSIWTENSKVYLSKSNELYEFAQDDVKLDETLKFNQLGRYQVVTPLERSTVPGSAARKPHAAKRVSSGLNAVREQKPVAKVTAAPAVAPSVAVPAAAASTAAVVKPLPQPAGSPVASVTTVQESAPPAAAPPQPSAVPMGSGFPIAFLLIVLAVSLLMIVSCWVVYEHAGQAGWKSLIPFYNMYVLMEISGKPGWWMFLLFIPLVGLAIYLFAMLSLAKKFGRSELFGVGIFLLPMIFLPILAFGDSRYQG